MAEPYAALSAEETAALLRLSVHRRNQHGTPPDVVPYDFRRPAAPVKVQEQLLDELHNTLAQALSGSLSAYLRSTVQVEAESRETMRYDAFPASLPAAVTAAVCGLSPMAGRCVLTLDAGLALVWVDRLMGGPGALAGDARALTDIETALIRRAFERILTCWRQVWPQTSGIAPALEQMVNMVELPQVLPGAEEVLVLTFTVAMHNFLRSLHLCIPWALLSEMLPKASQPTGEAYVEAETFSPQVAAHLPAIPVTVRVELGEATITVAELLDLQVGDCVVLNTREGDELPVQVAGETRLWGCLGVAGQRYAVGITRWDGTDETVGDDVAGNGGTSVDAGK